MLFDRFSSSTFGAAWIPRDYSAGAGQFCVVFTQQLDTKLNNLKSICLIDLEFSSKMSHEEHSCKIWLQKTKHEKRYWVLRINLLNPNFVCKRVASHAQQQQSDALWTESVCSIQKSIIREFFMNGTNFVGKIHKC